MLVEDETDYVELIRRCQAHDQEARRELYHRKASLVIGWAKRMAPPDRDGVDVAHDVFIAVFTGRGGLRQGACVDAWLFRITKNAAFRPRRLVDRLTRLVGTLPLADLIGEPPGDPWIKDRVRTALESLRAEHREVVVLIDIEDRTAPEVANLLGIPEGTVRSRLRKARLKLERELRHLDLDGERPHRWGSGDPIPERIRET